MKLKLVASINKEHLATLRQIFLEKLDSMAMAGDDGNMNIVVNLITQDGFSVLVNSDVIRMSATIRTMLEGLENPEPEVSIKVPYIQQTTLERVIEWCTQHKDDPEEPVISKEDKDKELLWSRRTEDISAWDADFLKRDDATAALFALYKAAEYLDITGLLDLTCKYFARQVKISLMNPNKEAALEEIRKSFQIRNDLNPVELEQIKLEQKWCLGHAKE